MSIYKNNVNSIMLYFFFDGLLHTNPTFHYFHLLIERKTSMEILSNQSYICHLLWEYHHPLFLKKSIYKIYFYIKKNLKRLMQKQDVKINSSLQPMDLSHFPVLVPSTHFFKIICKDRFQTR